MDLHNLHNPSPSTRQQAPVSNITHAPACQDTPPRAPACQQDTAGRAQACRDTPIHASDSLSQRLQDARAQAAHWQNEAHKMDKIACALTDKLAAKKQARQALKADLEAMRQEAETWRARCRQAMAKAPSSTQGGEGPADSQKKELAASQKELAASQKELAASQKELAASQKELAEARSVGARIQRDLAEARSAGARIQKELAEARSAGARTQTELAEARELAKESRRELARQAAELPGVQQRLEIGGEAFRKLKSLEPMLRQAQLKEKRLEESLASATARAQETDLELAASKERLRAAAQSVLAGKCQADASTSMLRHANQVLQTCSQLFTGKQEHPEMAEALRDTTATISSFLATLG